ncbi:fibronectin type III domain-containing protein, partial [Tannerella forsythia]
MKRIKQLSIWMIALLAITVTNPAWAWGDYDEPTGGSYEAGYPKAVGTTPVELKWTKGNENVTPQNRLRYWVDWKKKSGEGAGKSAPMIDITTYTLTGLEPIFEFMIDLEDPTPGKYGTVTTTLTTATINWTKATDNKTKQNKLRYQVFWYKAIGGPITRTEWMTDITTYTITGLEPNTEYILEVEVRDESVNYISYGKRWFKTKAPVDKKDPTPGTYEAGYPKAVGSTSIEVRWTKGIDDVTPQDRLMYWVYWYTESGERLGKTATMIDITTYTITGLEPSTKYKVVVLVGDEVGRYNTYGGRTVKTQAVPDYDRPTAGSYGTITATANSITVNWTRGTDDITPQNKLRYKVVWKEKSSTMFGNGSILYTDMTSYTLTDLKPNTEYILEVQVWDEANKYKFYGERTVKTKADTQDPTWGSWGTNTSTATTITLNWTKATDNATPQKKLRYQVLWKKKSATSWNYTGLKKNITTHTLTGLDPDTEYDVNVEVRDETDHTAYYGYITVKTKVLDTEKPKAGCNGKITIGTVTANSIALSWCAATDNVTPKDKLRYQVAWKKKSSTSWAWTFFSTNITTYTLTGLDPDTEYQVDVLVYDEVENRSYYGVREVKTKAAGGGSSDTQRPTPGSYEAGYPKAVGATSIELKWTRGRDNKTAQADLQYVVYWKKSSESAWQASHSGPATNFPKDWTAYTITGLQPNTEYIMIVLVQDEAGNYTDYRPRTVKTQAAGATIAVTGVTLSPASLSLEVGQTGGLTATVAPATATNKKVTWTSSNTAVATVD